MRVDEDDAYGLSFEPKKILSPALWLGVVMKPDVRRKLLDIAFAFTEFLGIAATPVDVRLTGSMANYNYTDASDIDLHVIFDFKKEGWDSSEALADTVRELFIAKKAVWNNDHDLVIDGHPVELYAQDSKEPHTASGLFSVTANDWVSKPSRDNVQIDYEDIRQKTKCLMQMIDMALLDGDTETLDKVKEKIRSMRREALQQGGEYSAGNLAFKILRHSGYLTKLSQAYMQALDQSYVGEAYYDADAEEAAMQKAEQYFAIGHHTDDEGSEGEPVDFCWIWDGNALHVGQGYSHNMTFSPTRVDRAPFKGWFDVADKTLSFVDQRRVPEILSVDDIPERVYQHLRRQFRFRTVKVF